MTSLWFSFFQSVQEAIIEPSFETQRKILQFVKGNFLLSRKISWMCPAGTVSKNELLKCDEETEKYIVMSFDLPGVKKENLNIEVKDSLEVMLSK